MYARITAAALVSAALALAQLPRPASSDPPANTSGIAPRSSPGDYPVRQSVPGVTVGATVLTPAQIKKLFPTNLDSLGYIVVEIGVFPDPGTQATVDTDQFRLQIGDDRTMRRPSDPVEIISVKPHSPGGLPSNIPVSTTATIGYESGGPYNRGGVYGGSSTTVGNRPPVYGPAPTSSPSASGKDPDAVLRELIDKELATGKTTVPVAGYLYFAKPKQKQKNPVFDLTYRGSGEAVHLAIPATTK